MWRILQGECCYRRGFWWDSLRRLPMHTHDPLSFPALVVNHSSQCGNAMNESPSHLRQTSNHIYTVELRFSGDVLEPSEITQRLNLQPSNSLSDLGQSLGGKKRRPFWAYNGYGEDGFQAEWLSLDQGLAFLLRRLSSSRTTIIELSRRFDGLWWCGHFQASFDGGPTLSPAVLAEIAEYRLPLTIDNYFSSVEQG